MGVDSNTRVDVELPVIPTADVLQKLDNADNAKTLREWQVAISEVLRDMNINIYRDVRVSRPEITASDTQPVPENNHSIIWRDTSTGKKYILYNDNGTVYKTLMDGTDLGDGTQFELVSNKNAASGYCPLDSGTKVPTTNLGGAGADNTKWLRGDQTWQALPADVKMVGDPVQEKYYQRSDSINNSTAIPYDDTIPQSNEGGEVLTLAITPTNASNLLRIDVLVNGMASSGAGFTIALFKDADNNALAAVPVMISSSIFCTPGYLTFWMAAGTTSQITFKVRAGATSAVQFTLNGNSAARKLGGVLYSGISITEYKV